MIYGIINFSDFGGDLEAFIDTLAKANELLKSRGIVAPVQLSNTIESALQSEKTISPEIDENGLPIIKINYGSPLVNLWMAIKGFQRFKSKGKMSREESALFYLSRYPIGNFKRLEPSALRMISQGAFPLTYAPDCIDAPLNGDAGTLTADSSDDDAMMTDETDALDDGAAY